MVACTNQGPATVLLPTPPRPRASAMIFPGHGTAEDLDSAVARAYQSAVTQIAETRLVHVTSVSEFVDSPSEERRWSSFSRVATRENEAITGARLRPERQVSCEGGSCQAWVYVEIDSSSVFPLARLQKAFVEAEDRPGALIEAAAYYETVRNIPVALLALEFAGRDQRCSRCADEANLQLAFLAHREGYPAISRQKLRSLEARSDLPNDMSEAVKRLRAEIAHHKGLADYLLSLEAIAARYERHRFVTARLIDATGLMVSARDADRKLAVISFNDAGIWITAPEQVYQQQKYYVLEVAPSPALRTIHLAVSGRRVADALRSTLVDDVADQPVPLVRFAEPGRGTLSELDIVSQLIFRLEQALRSAPDGTATIIGR